MAKNNAIQLTETDLNSLVAGNLSDDFKSKYPNLVGSYPVFGTIRGSRMQGLDTEGSDTDLYGVLFNPLWALYPFTDVSTVEDHSHNYLYHDLYRFLQLLESGDINVVEMVNGRNCLAVNLRLKWILDEPEKFITMNYLVSVSEFIFNQLKTVGHLKDQKQKNKMFCHIHRVANMVTQMIEESLAAGKVVPLKVNRAEIDRDELLSIKVQSEENQKSFDEMKQAAEVAKDKYESLLEKEEVTKLFPPVIDDSLRKKLWKIPIFLLSDKKIASLRSKKDISTLLGRIINIPIPIKTKKKKK